MFAHTGCHQRCLRWVRFLCLGFALSFVAVAHGQSLRFYGNGVNDIDRVKIRIDDPASYNDPGPPADVGATDFTIELWLRPTSGNAAGSFSCGNNYNWIRGNIVFDRDRYSQGRSFGLSLGAGRVAFGIASASWETITLCGGPDLRDGGWHHVAIQRRRSDGYLWLYVDGQLRAQARGPSGDISYPDNGVPGRYCGPNGNQACTNSDPFIVLGAEKHDAGSGYPAYSGWIDELRISTVLRYSGNFAVPTAAFSVDGNTAALYHFDEGSGEDVIDAVGNRSPGVRRYGGSPAGPVWTSDTPLGAGSPNPGQINFTASSYSGREGDGAVTIAVTRTGGSSGAASIDYSIASGSAIAGADFQSTSGTLRWLSGESGERTFTVSVYDDSSVESSETATLTLTNAIGASPGSPTTATLSIADNDTAAPDTGFLDTFSRADSGVIGGGWIEKNGAAFSLQNGRAMKLAAGSDYRNNLVYRPAAEDLANVEVAVEFRLNSTSPGYPAVAARVQNPAAANAFNAYLLYIAASTTSASIGRQTGSAYDTVLAHVNLSSALNTTDTYRLRLRVTGSAPVAITGYVERLNGGTWQIIGSTSVSDNSSSRISGAGSIGFTGDFEAAYSFDNVSRVAL